MVSSCGTPDGRRSRYAHPREREHSRPVDGGKLTNDAHLARTDEENGLPSARRQSSA
jgi:hypothetical protein